MYAFIHPEWNDTALVGLAEEGRVLVSEQILGGPKRSEQIVPVLRELLSRQHVAASDLSGVAAMVGPGGFSAMRTAASVANALGLALGVPVAKIPAGPYETVEEVARAAQSALRQAAEADFLEPEYGVEPTVTAPAR